MDFDTEGRDVLLFEFPRKVTLDERRLADSTVPDEDQFELRCLLSLQIAALVNIESSQQFVTNGSVGKKGLILFADEEMVSW